MGGDGALVVSLVLPFVTLPAPLSERSTASLILQGAIGWGRFGALCGGLFAAFLARSARRDRTIRSIDDLNLPQMGVLGMAGGVVAMLGIGAASALVAGIPLRGVLALVPVGMVFGSASASITLRIARSAPTAVPLPSDPHRLPPSVS